MVYMDEGNTGAGGDQVSSDSDSLASASDRLVISDASNDDASVLSIDHDQQDSGIVQQVAPVQPTMQTSIQNMAGVESMSNVTPTSSVAGVPGVSLRSASSNTILNTTTNLGSNSGLATDSGSNSGSSVGSAPIDTSQSATGPMMQAQSADQLVSQTFTAGGVPVRPNISGSVQQLVQNSPMPSPYSGQSAFSIANSAGSVAGNEDVVLASNGKVKSSKKKILLFLAAIGVVGLIVGICMIVMNSNGLFNSGASMDEMHASLNRYVNYLLSETESDMPLTNDINWSTSEIENKISVNDSSERNKYFDELVEKYDVFLAVFTKDVDFSSSLDDSGLMFYDGLTKGIKESLDTLRQYAVTQNMSVDDMVELCLQIGKDGMLSRVDELYGDFLSNKEGTIYEYSRTKEEIAGVVGELYSYYVDSQCVDSATFDDQCVEDHRYDETAENYRRNLDSLTLEQFIMERKIKDDVVDFSKMLYQAINIQEEDE